MKKGYVVNTSSTSYVELIEVNIIGTVINDDETLSVIDAKNFKTIWSSDGNIRKFSYFSNKGSLSGNFNTTLVRNDVVFDLVVAKQMAQDALAAAIISIEKSYSLYKERLNNLQQPIDWGAFPKDEYISPFTGKKT